MDQSFLTSIVPLIAIFAIMYFLMIRPQQQRVKKHREMVDGVRRGDTAITSGGIVGKVIKVDETYVELELGTNVRVKAIKATSRCRSRGLARRADHRAADNDPIAMIEPSRPNSPGPLAKTFVAISAIVIWKFMPKVPSTKTSSITNCRSGRPRT